MHFKCGILFLSLLGVARALPTLDDGQDMSVFFEHVDRSARIVGGTQAAFGSHPHMVSLHTSILISVYFCGGSIIGTRTVLTAAHCVNQVFTENTLSRSLRGVVGSNTLYSGGLVYTFTRNVTHPNYVVDTIRNDISLLITAYNIANATSIRTIALNYDWVDADLTVRVAGWGRTAADAPFSSDLLELTLWTIDGNRCIREAAQAAIDFDMRNAPNVEPHIEICTFHSAGRGICNGDSGSALVRIDRGEQVGIVSWGFPCARGAPDMFVRISAFKNWIVTNTD